MNARDVIAQCLYDDDHRRRQGTYEIRAGIIIDALRKAPKEVREQLVNEIAPKRKAASRAKTPAAD